MAPLSEVRPAAQATPSVAEVTLMDMLAQPIARPGPESGRDWQRPSPNRRQRPSAESRLSQRQPFRRRCQSRRPRRRSPSRKPAWSPMPRARPSIDARSQTDRGARTCKPSPMPVAKPEIACDAGQRGQARITAARTSAARVRPDGSARRPSSSRRSRSSSPPSPTASVPQRSSAGRLISRSIVGLERARAGFRAPAREPSSGRSVRRLIFQPAAVRTSSQRLAPTRWMRKPLVTPWFGHLVRLGGRMRRDDLQIRRHHRACRRRSRCAAGPRNARARRRSRPGGPAS